MELEQLLANIEKARDKAREDAQDRRRQSAEEAAKGDMQGAAAAAGLANVAVALEIVDRTLSRILGEEV